MQVLTTCVDPRYLRNQMLHLDVRHASLLRDCDKDWLLDQLMSRGVVRVNRMVRAYCCVCAVRVCARVRARVCVCVCVRALLLCALLLCTCARVCAGLCALATHT